MLNGLSTPLGVTASPHPSARSGRRRAWVFAVAALLLLSLSGVSFLASNDELALSIQPRPAPPAGGGSTLTAGQTVKVTAVQGANITISPGKANVDAGRLIYKIEVHPNVSHLAAVSMLWVDPLNANGALKNGWIESALYYQAGVDTGAGCPVGQYSIAGINEANGASTQICAAPAADQATLGGKALMTAAYAATVLRSTVTGKRYLYVLVSAHNNGGNLPPGQQSQLGALKFDADVRINGG